MKIAVGIPVFDTVPGEALGPLLRTGAEVARHGKVVFLTPVGMNPHDRARMFVAGIGGDMGCDYLFFVDADTVVPPGAFPKLLKTLQENKVQAVSGYYYRRGYPYTSVWAKRNGVDNEWHHVEAKSGLHEIESSGLGCCLIDLKWVQANMTRPYFVCKQHENGTLITDDISFFEQMRERGGKLLGDADVRCSHVHTRLLITDKNVDSLRREQVHTHLSEIARQD